MLRSRASSRLLRTVLAALSTATLVAGCGWKDVQGTMCLTPQTPDTCPSEDDAATFFEAQLAGAQYSSFDSVDGPGKFNSASGECCYPVTTDYDTHAPIEGRPMVVEHDAVVAPIARGSSTWLADIALPDVSALAPELRARLAATWAEAASFEHASVASFARFALDLLAHGAPADLVEAAHAAALDEVRHARVAFAFATAYAGEPIRPGAIPIGASLPIAPDLVTLAVSAAREGCINETGAALVALEEAALATDPAVRRALATIAEDESRHAALAWRAVAWAIEAGGEDVRRAVAAVFAEPAPITRFATDLGPLAPHGRLDADAVRSLMARARREVIAPCAARLLAA